MSLLKSIKTLFGFVLLGLVGTWWIGCSDSAPVASRPVGKATCSLCEFLGDDTYTAADGQAAPESPDTTQTDAETDADSTQTAAETDADSTQTAAETDADGTQTDADADGTQSATVEFADANLERCVREALNRPQGPLTPADLAALTELDASHKNIESVAGLEYATALHTLYLRDNAITDVSPLAGLTNLQSLSLWGNAVTDVSPLANLINLQKLSLWGNEITNVQPLARLTNLQWLQLGDNEIEDVSPLASLPNLQWLGVMENALSQHEANQQLAASPASGLRVEAVIEKYPRVETVQTEPLEEIIPDDNLERAVRTALGRSDGDNITAADLATLTELDARDKNIESLAGLEHATALSILQLYNNAIMWTQPLRMLTDLEILYLSKNQIRDIRPLADLTNVQLLYLGDNAIANISPLASLTNVRWLVLDDNQIRDIQPLFSMTSLRLVSLNNNPLNSVSTEEHIPALRANGVLVYF